MNEIRLLAFYQVVQKNSFSKAAEEMNLTQPAISKQIKTFEEELNTKLLDRTSGGVELTPAGKVVFHYTENILKEIQKLKNELSLLSEAHQGELHLGASTTAAQYILPPLLARYKQVNPNISITLLNENSSRIEQLLIAGQINLGIIEGLPKNNELEYTPFLNDELVAIVHQSSKYYKLDTISMKKLQQIPLVIRENGSGTLEVLKHYLHENQVQWSDLNIAMQLGSTESIKLYLQSADAIGIVSIRAISKDILLNGFKVIEFDGARINRKFYFVRIKRVTDNLTNHFIRFALSPYNQML